MKPKYALTEVSSPRLVQALCKTSTSCIDPVILFDKDDKIGQSILIEILSLPFQKCWICEVKRLVEG